MMTNARRLPAPTDASLDPPNSGSNSAASAGSATIPTAMLEAVMPT